MSVPSWKKYIRMGQSLSILSPSLTFFTIPMEFITQAKQLIGFWKERKSRNGFLIINIIDQRKK
jgi:hypothetical protein